MAFTQATIGLNNMDADSISQICMRLIAQSFFFLAVTRVIPEIAGALVSGASTTGMHTVNAIRAGGTAAGAAVAGAVSGAYHMPIAVADGYAKNKSAVEGAVNAYSSKFEASRANGHSPLVAGVSALGGTLWGAYREAQQTHAASNPTSQSSQSSQKFEWQDMVSTSEPRPTQPASPINPLDSTPASGASGASGSGAPGASNQV
ncbi:MAG: hypothetical protein LBJ22_06435, partial [Synergistaceae bacterium]|jgi:hypothetical protein|nr:hypothetical protein [Synergistaceae bacterium]